jgi:sigma-E factor negative regulatory protein RseB
MRKWIVTLVGALFSVYLSAAPPLNISQNPTIWLTKATHAARTLSYQGTFLHQYGKNTTNYQLTHTKVGNDELELREVLDGPVREYYRLNNTVTVLWPDRRAVILDRRDALKLFPDQFFNGVNDILANYAIAFGRKGRVAGLEAQELTLTPKDDYRYSHQFWIHPESGLLLKSVMLDKKNLPLEVFSFSSLKMSFSIDKRRLIPPKFTPVPMPLIQDSQIATPTVKKLPSGFKLIRHMVRILGEKNKTRQYLYSDGLVAVSVFVEPVKSSVKQGLFSQDGTYAYIKQSGAYQITVLGDVPSATVEAFAHAFVF